MACTSQSSLEYLRNARVQLVEGLRNLSIILENLYKQGVLHDEEVSKIKAEKDDYDRTRAILCSVTKKGEAACYQLLKIIYQTRKRTLERPDPVFKKSHEASTEAKKFDLNHWISCFSFTEDVEMDANYMQGPRPCHKYQSKLKSKGKKLSNEFWRANRNLFMENKSPDLSYTSLVLDTQEKLSPSKIKKLKSKKSKLSRPKKFRTYLPEDKPKLSSIDLLKTDKNILLVGKPGIGKTALSHEMLRLWTERDNKDLDYMFYFDMREITSIPPTMGLEDLLFNVYIKPDEGKDEALQDIENNSDNVTVILDGVTKLSSLVVKKLVEKDLLPDAKIIITCRPDDEEDLCPEDWLRVEVKGFSEETIKTYLSTTLGEDHREGLSNVELVTLCHVPMYALMVAASFSSGDSLQPRTVTEICINIVRICLQINSNKTRIKNLNQFIKTKGNEILSLAEAAFYAIRRKTVNLEELSCDDSCILSFLKQLDVKVAPTETRTVYAFLHYTMQEFFAALWLLKNPDKIREVFQQCLTEKMKHMKHLIPFMCRLLIEKSPCLMSCLTPAEQLQETRNWFMEEMIDTFFTKADDSELYVDTLFLCQCLYESQSSEACVYFLNKLDFYLDLSGEDLDPHSCCAVAYVVTQSKEKKINLNLEDVTVSEQGMKQFFGCLQNVEWYDSLPQQLWRIVLLGEVEKEHIVTLLHLCKNDLHLPVVGKKQLFERAVKVTQRAAKVNVCLYWAQGGTVCPSLYEFLLQALPNLSNLRFYPWRSDLPEQTRLLVNLFCAAAEREQQTGEKMLQLLASVCRYKRFPVEDEYMDDEEVKYRSDFLLDLYSQMKDRETKTGLSLLPSLQSVFQSAPAVWTIDLSERKTSILLEVLRLQPEKKPVKLTGCSQEESEVRSFLRCLPYISQLSCSPGFFQSICSSISVRSREEVHQLVSLLQLLDFNLLLTGELRRKTCRSVSRVLQLCGSKVDLVLKANKMSARGASVLFRPTTHLHSLRQEPPFHH
ncbi:nucleotide-binding oligomerization domain-containing protein 1-like isoform 2-T2 [Fundulus diaphanus]